ncbi:MAG: hypothetical protein P0Y52_07935 [Candidatus Brevundimonas phytovorans]|nr:hypothetical protein [Brevundimonas sp.]WEK56488.1 MAG: hypothetical protein P0Y52_07935 [Brevundimonas sp.]
MIATALAGLQAEPPARPPLGPPTNALFSGARSALDARLFDFPSARFRDVRGDANVLCGFVNAKNRLGAYTGWKRFAYVAFGDDPSIYFDEPDGSGDIMLDAACGDDGLRRTGPDYSARISAPRN